MIMLSVVYAAPQPQSLDKLLVIETLGYEYHPYNETYYLHAHIHDATTGLGLDLTKVDCSYHLYAQHINWQHLNTGQMTPQGFGVFAFIDAGNFTNTGDYAFLLFCEYLDTDPTPDILFGGYKSYFFTVSHDTTANNDNVIGFDMTIITLIILALLVALAIAIKNGVIGIVAGIGIIIQALYFMLDSILLGSLTLVVGVILAIYFATLQSN